MGICICTTDLICYTPETNTIYTNEIFSKSAYANNFLKTYKIMVTTTCFLSKMFYFFTFLGQALAFKMLFNMPPLSTYLEKKNKLTSSK